MCDEYKEFSKVYDIFDIDIISVNMANDILKYLEKEFPNKNYYNHLDFCCGTGSLCNFFYKENIATKGIDISESMFKRAKSKYPDIEFICDDVITFRDSNKYDLITCINDSINHFTNINQLKKLFKNVYNLLNKDGLFILDCNDYDYIPINEVFIKYIDNDLKLRYYLTKLDERCINNNIQYYIKEDLKFDINIKEYNYSFEEIINILKDTGFEIKLSDKSFGFKKDSNVLLSEDIKWKFIAMKK